MPRRFARTALAPLLLVLCLCLGAAQAAASAGAVVGLSGVCMVERGGQRFGLQIGTPVELGDTVQVPPDGKLKLRMSDGSILSLAANTVLRIDAYAVDAAGKRLGAGLSMGEGLMRAVTAPVDRPASFEVNTAVGTAAVRSTDWFVESTPGGTTVAVLGGAVLLASRATGHGVVIPQGSGSQVAPGGDPAPPRAWSPGEFAALIARTETGPAGAPPPPPPGGYPPGYEPGSYPPPGYYPPGGYPPNAGYSPLPGVTIPFGVGIGIGGFGGHRGGGREWGGQTGGRNPTGGQTGGRTPGAAAPSQGQTGGRSQGTTSTKGRGTE